MKRKILIGILIVLILVQFIRPRRNTGQALGRNDITHEVQVPENIMGIFKKSCFDCHSNHTDYPWYAEINPVSWWLANHIDEGKEELNFSEFGTYDLKKKDKKLEETAEMVQEGEMPLSSYTFIHKDARLTEAERKSVIEWAEKARQELHPAAP